MNLHEYQAKSLLAAAQVGVPRGELIENLAQLGTSLEKLGGESWVVKAQIHAGARGKAGGVGVVRSIQEAKDLASKLLGSSLATEQTAGVELPINSLLIEETLEIARELYLSLVIDRASKSYRFVMSGSGGMEIEELAEKHPEQIFSFCPHPVTGVMPFQVRQAAEFLELNKEQARELAKLLPALYNLALEKDLFQLEINPLIITQDDGLIALDAKISLDPNALYRQKDLAEWRDVSQEDAREVAAAEYQLNYIALDGNIGCMVNGAGLAMATMDLIKFYGGSPANFLDVGGGTTSARVAAAFKLILSSPEVKAILVNIFGGIVRCDLIAEGIIQAVEEVGLNIPVVVRLEGTNVELGRELLAKSGLQIVSVNGLEDAAKTVVKLAGGV